MKTTIRYIYLQFLSKIFSVFKFKEGNEGLQWEDRLFCKEEKNNNNTIKFLIKYWNYK